MLTRQPNDFSKIPWWTLVVASGLKSTPSISNNMIYKIYHIWRKNKIIQNIYKEFFKFIYTCVYVYQ